MDPTNNEVVREFPMFFRIYKDGRIERFLGLETTPPGTDAATGVQSKDVIINPETGVGARLFLPPNLEPSQKLPLLIYIHGGAFCVCSPFNPGYHLHMNAVAAKAKAVVVSVHYRLAPESPMPICYDDTWEAIEWSGKHAGGNGPEGWLNEHADLGRVFLAGDSAGANIAHNMAMRGAAEAEAEGGGFGGLKVEGIVLVHPYFGSEEKDRLVEFLYPTYTGTDDHKIHSPKDPNLHRLGCGRVLILVAENDFLRDRAWSYYEALKRSGWPGTLDIIESPAENHVFHLLEPTKPSSASLLQHFVRFLTVPL